ncbi:hypothetical protein [Massilia sp. 9I]|uniref:hypothetical protein n=1 Tax=Massilia sp. 9I TaxID=2653152 RepID=UPI0012F38F21|nr:hypothetical protein [Massilia sp. 9I]VXC51525.1 conserved membrane hypothetical protein [Massilia sp. 9I]
MNEEATVEYTEPYHLSAVGQLPTFKYQTGLQIKVRTFLFHSYLFWVLFSLLNFSYFWFFILPFWLFFLVPKMLRMFPFFWTPAVLAMICSALSLVAAVIVAQRKNSNPIRPVFLAWAFNGTFLLVFVTAAEYKKNVLIERLLASRHPECVHVNTFLTSILHAGEDFNFVEHALFKENEKTFYWSYRTMSFFEGNERLDPNFPCKAD